MFRNLCYDALMKAFLFILLGFVWGISAALAQEDVSSLDTPSHSGADWDNSSQYDDGGLKVFVGRKIFAEERAKPEYYDVKRPDGSIVKLSMRADPRYEARYKVLDMVEGTHEGPTLDFVAYDHYGRPAFLRFDTVLLFVVSHSSEWVHSKYLYYPVHRTTDGDWAICGQPYVHDEEPDAHKKLAASYEEPLGFIEPQETRSGEFCTTGTRAKNLFYFEDKTRFIPRRNRVLCNREIGIRDNVVAGTGSGPFAEIEGQKHVICMERLEAKILP